MSVLLQAASTGLPKDSVANVAQLLTIDEDYLTDRAGRISRRLMRHVERGLRLVLGLWPDWRTASHTTHRPATTAFCPHRREHDVASRQ